MDVSGILRLVGATTGLILGPPLVAVMLGGAQLGIYRLLVRVGWIGPDQVPMFPILIMRGLFLIMALIAAVVFWLRFGEGRPGFPRPETAPRTDQR